MNNFTEEDIKIFKALLVLVQRDFGTDILEDLLHSKGFHNIISEELYHTLNWWLSICKANAEGYRTNEAHEMYKEEPYKNRSKDLDRLFDLINSK